MVEISLFTQNDMSYKSKIKSPGAADLLMDMIIEVDMKATATKAKNGENQTYAWLKKVSATMKYSWDYIQSIHFLAKENELLKSENEYLKWAYNEKSKMLDAYETVRELKLTGNFDEVVSLVDKVISQDASNG